MPGKRCVRQVPPKLALRLQHDERLGRTLVLQVPRRADAGDSGADDDDIEGFVAAGGRCAESHGLHRFVGSGVALREHELECDRPSDASDDGMRARVQR